MYVGLIDRPFVTNFNSWESWYLTRVPDGPQTYILNIHWHQEKGALTYLMGSPAKEASAVAHCTEHLRDALFLELPTSISQSPW
jgi:hypothetical protein